MGGRAISNSFHFTDGLMISRTRILRLPVTMIIINMMSAMMWLCLIILAIVLLLGKATIMVMVIIMVLWQCLPSLDSKQGEVYYDICLIIGQIGMVLILVQSTISIMLVAAAASFLGLLLIFGSLLLVFHAAFVFPTAIISIMTAFKELLKLEYARLLSALDTMSLQLS